MTRSTASSTVSAPSMPADMRIAILGGSGSATPELADALAAWPGGIERRPELDIVLTSRSRERLDLVAGETGRRSSGLEGAPIRVLAESDLERALDGADVVINAVRIGGLPARVFDETFPQTYGIPGEETMGPGGFANALRTVPAVLPLWRRAVDVAPDALLINLTNPSGVVVAAAEAELGTRIFSVCDSPTTFCEAIAGRLGRPVDDVRRGYSGMNHLGWWVPDDEADLAAVADLGTGLDADAVTVQGAVGAAYVRYYVHPGRILEKQRAAAETRAQQLQQLERDLLDGYAAGTTELPRRGAAWYGKAVLPLVDAWLNGSDEILTLGLRNDGRIEGLPDDVVTEAPVRISRPRHVEFLGATPLPPEPAARLAQHAAYERLVVAATSSQASRTDAVRALMANPMVASFDDASGLLDDIEAGSPT